MRADWWCSCNPGNSWLHLGVYPNSTCSFVDLPAGSILTPPSTTVPSNGGGRKGWAYKLLFQVAVPAGEHSKFKVIKALLLTNDLNIGENKFLSFNPRAFMETCAYYWQPQLAGDTNTRNVAVASLYDISFLDDIVIFYLYCKVVKNNIRRSWKESELSY